MDEVTQITHLQAVALQPGDVIVVSMPHKISAQDHDRLERMATNVFPGHKVLVIDSGVQLGVASKVDRLSAIERKLDQLLASLAADEEEEPRFSLDGQPAGAERDGNESLG
jgi:hypothetical protein